MEHYWHCYFCYFFLLTTCQYLSALAVRLMDNEPLLNVYIFHNTWQKYVLGFFCLLYRKHMGRSAHWTMNFVYRFSPAYQIFGNTPDSVSLIVTMWRTEGKNKQLDWYGDAQGPPNRKKSHWQSHRSQPPPTYTRLSCTNTLGDCDVQKKLL